MHVVVVVVVVEVVVIVVVIVAVRDGGWWLGNCGNTCLNKVGNAEWTRGNVQASRMLVKLV